MQRVQLLLLRLLSVGSSLHLLNQSIFILYKIICCLVSVLSTAKQLNVSFPLGNDGFVCASDTKQHSRKMKPGYKNLNALMLRM